MTEDILLPEDTVRVRYLRDLVTNPAWRQSVMDALHEVERRESVKMHRLAMDGDPKAQTAAGTVNGVQICLKRLENLAEEAFENDEEEDADSGGY